MVAEQLGGRGGAGGHEGRVALLRGAGRAVY